MNEHDLQLLFDTTESSRVLKRERIQELWSGYGQIERVYLDSDTTPTVITKK